MTVQARIDATDLEPQGLDFSDIAELASSGRVCAIRAIIQPQVARRMIATMNKANRPVRAAQRAFLGEQMSEGLFTFNGESIVLSVGGRILNGQHRLLAAGDSDTPIEVLLVFGIPDDTFATLDQVSARSGSDAIHVSGGVSGSITAGAIRQLDNYDNGGTIGQRNIVASVSGKLSNTRLLDLAKKYKKLEVSVRRAQIFYKNCRLSPPSVVAALHYLFSKVDAASAEEFFEIVESGIEAGRKYDKPLADSAGQLRKTLINHATGVRKADSETLAALWIKAWNAFMRGDSPQVFAFRKNEEQPRVKGL